MQKSLSVLIPNYDWNVTSLIQELHHQLINSKVDFEIICFDDCLDSIHHASNEKLNNLNNVHYQVNKQPLSRAQNRNALAKLAKYNFLLFLDGDAGLQQNSNFILNYLSTAKLDTVVCGGTAYETSRPTNPAYLLRYVYGKNREEISPSVRQKEAWAGFSAFNFLIPSAVFEKIKFNEALSDYGHEDTLFGNDLKYHCIAINHIANPALHLGLDSNETFLAKTKKGVVNLRGLIDAGLVDEDLKLYAWYARARKVFLTSLLRALYENFHAKWEGQLSGNNPNLKLFDLYKLTYLCSLPVNHHVPPKRKI